MSVVIMLNLILRCRSQPGLTTIAPLEIRINELKVKYEDNEEAQKILNNELKEIVMYKQYSAYYGYEFYVLRSTK